MGNQIHPLKVLEIDINFCDCFLSIWQEITEMVWGETIPPANASSQYLEYLFSLILQLIFYKSAPGFIMDFDQSVTRTI